MKTHCQCPISASRLHRLSSSPGQHGVSKPATMSKGHPSSSSKVSGPRRMTPVEDAQSVEKRRRRLPAECFFGGISAAPSTNSQPAHRRSRGRTGKRSPGRPLHFVLRNFGCANQSPGKCVNNYVCAGCVPILFLISNLNVLLRVLLVNTMSCE